MNDSTPDNAGVITIPPIIYLVGLLLGLLIHYFLSHRISVAIRIGLVRCPVDSGGYFHSVIYGIYRLSRNPMYVSLAFVYLGIACWVNSLWILLLMVPVLVVVDQGIIKREEHYLEQKFGDEYLRYKSEVRRWI